MRGARKVQLTKKKGIAKKKRTKAAAPDVEVEDVEDVERGCEAEEIEHPCTQRYTAVVVVITSALFTLISIYVAQMWSTSPSDGLALVMSGQQQDASITNPLFSLRSAGAGVAPGIEVRARSVRTAKDGLWSVQDAQQPAPETALTIIPQSITRSPIDTTQLTQLPAVPSLPSLPLSPRQRGSFKHPRILWIHLHGYGGTTICDMARSQGEKVARSQDNCNVMPDLCSTPKVFRTPCKKRASSLQYTFTAIERAVDDDDLSCLGSAGSQMQPTMLYGIMLRDPLAGIKSTWIGNELEKDMIVNAIRSREKPRNFQYHFCLPPFDTYQHFDNFAVRSLSGDYDVDPGAVTHWHLARAKEVLSKLDVILILEQLPDHMPQLHTVFGWDGVTDNPFRSHRHRIPKNAMSPGEEAFLKKVNTFDYELYEFGKELALQRTLQAKLRSVS
ncbi:unnamed protein product [Symbiodinium natans]|uniref:Sulfotransferase domain-containing protein n=1 Tax=Symbiodinium natans TaxID=878477 RepID=A0A812TK38_9DINO|nr:unnamed protein product [Symbiodinium natans]